jgi:hypothetical protein
MTKSDEIEGLARLRTERKDHVDRARKIIKERNRQIVAIKTQLKKEAATVPEIAAAVGMQSSEVLLVISAMRKYGKIVEGAKTGNYFKYQLPEAEGEVK